MFLTDHPRGYMGAAPPYTPPRHSRASLAKKISARSQGVFPKEKEQPILFLILHL